MPHKDPVLELHQTVGKLEGRVDGLETHITDIKQGINRIFTILDGIRTAVHTSEGQRTGQRNASGTAARLAEYVISTFVTIAVAYCTVHFSK